MGGSGLGTPCRRRTRGLTPAVQRGPGPPQPCRSFWQFIHRLLWLCRCRGSGAGGALLCLPQYQGRATLRVSAFVAGRGWGWDGSSIFHPPGCGCGGKHPLPVEAVCWRPQPARWARSGCGSLWGPGTVTVYEISPVGPSRPGAGTGARGTTQTDLGSLRAGRRGLQVTCSCSSGDPRAL